MTRDQRWTNEAHRSWRWLCWFAWHPVKTFDAGWIWLRPYWRWQCSWGWGFFDDYPYLFRSSREEPKTERNRNNALLITAQTEEIRRLTIDRDAWRLTAKTFASGAQGTQAMTLVPCKWCGKLSDTYRLVCSPLLSWDRSARAEIERLTLENWQLKGALGYPVPGNIPEGPFKCGLCEARALQDPFRAGFETA